ncbi:MAG: energy-coupling factor transporter transmembrane component T [Micrococcales bacterium]
MSKIGKLIHPATWWMLGGALALLAGSATNLITPMAVSAFAVIAILIFREDATWTRSLGFYLGIAGVVITVRIIFRIIFSYTGPGSYIALNLPKLRLNIGFTYIEFLGDVSWLSLYGALLDGLRLAAIILAVAISTTLANPRKLLKSAPGALYEIATSISVAINLAPQLIESFNRVRKARQLRGKSKRTSRLAGIVVPVLEDTLDRSMLLAASMDARGFGRRGNQTNSELILARALGLAGLTLNLVGIFLLLSGFGSYLALGLVVIGISCGAFSVRLTSRRKVRTNLVSQKRTILDYWILASIIVLLVANFAGWLR